MCWHELLGRLLLFCVAMMCGSITEPRVHELLRAGGSHKAFIQCAVRALQSRMPPRMLASCWHAMRMGCSAPGAGHVSTTHGWGGFVLIHGTPTSGSKDLHGQAGTDSGFVRMQVHRAGGED